jgi:hypothetical protein
MLSRSIVVAAVVAAAGPIACSWSTTTEEPRVCTGPVTAVVSPGTPAQLSWTPRCGIKEIRVRAAGGQSTDPILWLLTAENVPLFPTVAYGVVPAGASAFAPPAALVAGRSYEAEFVPVSPSMASTRVTWQQ